MLKKTFILIFLFLTALPLYAAAGNVSPGDWKEIGDKKGIHVYERAKENSGRKDFKASLELTETPARVIQVLEAVENTPEWMVMLKDSETIEDSRYPETLYYFIWDIPIPFKDRDTISIRTKKEVPETKTIVIHYSAYTDDYPEHAERTRIHEFNLIWTVTTLEKTRVAVSLILETSREGGLPDLFSNQLMKLITEKSLSNLRKYLS